MSFPTATRPARPSAAALVPARNVSVAQARLTVPAGPPSVYTLMLALKRRWQRALLFGVVLCIPAAVVAFYFIPSSKFTARAQLHVSSLPEQIMFRLQQPEVTGQTYQQNQMALVKSRIVLKTALDQPQVAACSLVRQQKNPIEWLDKDLQVESAAEFLRISLSGDIADELQIIVKAVTDAYLTEIVNKEHNKRRERRDQLQDIYNGYDDSLRGKRQELKKLAEDAGAGTADAHNLAVAHKFAMESLAAAQKELLQTQSQLQSAEVDLSVLKAKGQAADDLVIPDYKIDKAMQKDPIIDGLYLQLTQIQETIAREERKFQPGKATPFLRDYVKQQDAVKDAIGAYRNRIRPTIEAQLRAEARDEYRVALAGAQDKISRLKDLEKGLSGKVERLTTETKVIHKSSLDLESKQAAIAKEENAQKKIGEEVEMLNVELRAPARVTLVEDSVVTRSRDESKPIKAGIMSGLAAFALAIFGVAWWESLARRISSTDEVIQGLGLKVIGTVPEVATTLRHGPVGRLTGDAARQGLLAESIDETRTILLHTARADGSKSVMVTSAVSGEGKTTLATQLAASLARAGLRTVLVDGDLRNPSAHRAFDLPSAPGFSEVLRGELALESALQQTAVDGLWLLGAGAGDHRAIQALAGDQVGTIFGRLERDFDFMVVDSSPVLPVADALSLGQHVDSVIVSVLRNVSQIRSVQLACEKLSMFGIRVLGAGVNGVRDEAYGTVYAVTTPATI